MSRSCQSATFSSPTTAFRAHDPREPADALGDDRVALVRHRRGALLAAAERLLDLAHLRAREVADLEREPLERGGDQRQRVEQLGVAVALEDLRRARRRLEAEPLAGDPLDLRVGGRVRADGARELADAHPFERARDACALPLELERPAGELQPERRRLGVDPVGATDRDRLALLLRSGDDGGQRRSMPSSTSSPASRSAVRERCRARPTTSGRSGPSGPPRRAPPRPRRRTRRRRGCLAPRSPPRARRVGRDAPGGSSDRLRGTTPSSAHASSAASSTSSHRAQLRLLRPDRRHGRPGVARNHPNESSARPGRSTAGFLPA